MKTSHLLEHCFEALGGESGPGHGVLYGKTSFDSLEWLQTPGPWGSSPSDNSYWTGDSLPRCSQRFLDAMSEIIRGAQRHLDIASLESFADGRFEAMLSQSLAELARTGRAVDVRILYGSHPFTEETPETLESWLARITSPIDVTSSLRIVTGRMASVSTGLGSSFNHAKIVAADGRRAIVGGHNLWSEDYFGFAPTNDLSALVEGEASDEAHRYLNRLWEWMAVNARQPKPEASSFTVGWEKGRITREVAAPPAPDFSKQSGKHQALFLSRFGTGILPEGQNGNLVTRCAADAFRAAKKSIFISHMDLAFHYEGTSYWPDQIFMALADAITDPLRNIDIRVVLSEPGGRSGSGGIYSWGVPLESVLEKMRSSVGNRPLSGTFRLAPIRFSAAGDCWRHGEKVCKITNHSKTWIVDESHFYIGSDNLYPHNLQEFGYLIHSETVAARVIDDYWAPLWEYSSPSSLGL